MHGLARLRMRDINPNLQCALCGGYLINATTIIECLHSFCRPCILRFLESCKFCPICDVQVHKTRPQVNLRRDKTLQDLVYKLVPGLFEAEMAQRREFYSAHPEEAPEGVDAREVRGDLPNHYLGPVYSSADPISVELTFCHTLKTTINGEVQEDLGEKRYLQCPALFTIRLLKKFIRIKYDLTDNLKSQVFLTDESLHENFTIMDVACLSNWLMKEPLKLKFLVYDSSKSGEILPPYSTLPPPVSSSIKAPRKTDLMYPYSHLMSDAQSDDEDKGENETETERNEKKESAESSSASSQEVVATTSSSVAAARTLPNIPEKTETLATTSQIETETETETLDHKNTDNRGDVKAKVDAEGTNGDEMNVLSCERTDKLETGSSRTFRQTVEWDPSVMASSATTVSSPTKTYNIVGSIVQVSSSQATSSCNKTSRDKLAAEIGLECRIIHKPKLNGSPSSTTKVSNDLSSKAIKMYEFSDEVEEKGKEPPRKNALAFLEEYVKYVHEKREDEDDEQTVPAEDNEGSAETNLNKQMVPMEMETAKEMVNVKTDTSLKDVFQRNVLSDLEVISEEEESGNNMSPEHQSSSGLDSNQAASPSSTGSPTQRVPRSRKHSRPRKRSDRKRSQADDESTHPKIIKTSPSANRFGDYDENEPIKITIKIPSPSSVKSPPRWRTSPGSSKKSPEQKSPDCIPEKTIAEEIPAETQKPLQMEEKPEHNMKAMEQETSTSIAGGADMAIVSVEHQPQDTADIAPSESTTESTALPMQAPVEDLVDESATEEKMEEDVVEPSGSDSLDLSIKGMTEQVNEGSAMVIESVNSVLQQSNEIPVPTQELTQEPVQDLTQETTATQQHVTENNMEQNMPPEVDGTSDVACITNVAPTFSGDTAGATTYMQPMPSTHLVHSSQAITQPIQYVVTSSNGGYYLTPSNMIYANSNALVSTSSASQIPMSVSSCGSNYSNTLSSGQFLSAFNSSNTNLTSQAMQQTQQLTPQFSAGHLINGNGNIIVNNTQWPLSQLASFQGSTNLSNSLQNGFLLPTSAARTLLPANFGNLNSISNINGFPICNGTNQTNQLSSQINGVPIITGNTHQSISNPQQHVIYPAPSASAGANGTGSNQANGASAGTFQLMLNTQQSLTSNPVIVNNPNVYYTQNNVGSSAQLPTGFPNMQPGSFMSATDGTGRAMDVFGGGGGMERIVTTGTKRSKGGGGNARKRPITKNNIKPKPIAPSAPSSQSFL